MATMSDSANLKTTARAARPRTNEYPAGGLAFDWAAVLLAGWFLAGLYLDGWAHNNLPGEFETFLTPWHAVLYSGFLAVSAFLIYHQARNVLKGYSFTRALPPGYWLALVGVAIFGFGGGFDFFWHNVFGFEEDIEALLSPAHMVLVTGGVLFATGPLRAAWGRSSETAKPGWASLAPALLSMFYVLGVLTFFTQYTHFIIAPYVLVERPQSDTFYRDLFGVTSVLLPTIFLMGALLFAARRWALPPGVVALMWGGNTLLMFLMNYIDSSEVPALMVATFLASLVVEGLFLWLKPSVERLGAVRVFAFLAPVILFLAYFVALLTTAGTWWTIHMWLGVTINAGIVGLFVSYLAFPPNGSQ